MERLLICGASTRAAAESAAKAGFRVIAIDAFADVDQHPSVRALSSWRDFGSPPTASGIAQAARRIESDAVVYLSPFENHPGLVGALASRRTLWGNSPDTLRRVRNPFVLAQTLRRHGFSVPNVSNGSNVVNDGWLLKPFRSGGGRHVRPWSGNTFKQGWYLQQHIAGTPGSLAFVAAGGGAVPLGLSRQLVGDPNFGADGYRYCGSIVSAGGERQLVDDALFTAATRLAQCIAREFNLVGLNGVDFVERDGTPFPVEVNPRWSASMEVVEQRHGVSLLRMHADACMAGTLPPQDVGSVAAERPARGKAIVYARAHCEARDTAGWLEGGMVRDVPREGERFRTGQPVCTVLADGADVTACYTALVEQAERIYSGVRLLSGRRVVGVSD